jgi:hypothetical protein
MVRLWQSAPAHQARQMEYERRGESGGRGGADDPLSGSEGGEVRARKKAPAIASGTDA